MSQLFTPLAVRSVTLRNRVVVSPMCQYSASEGFPNQWHLVHLGSRAVGGAGLVFTEATAVLPEGRITPQDTGIWSDEQAQAWAPIARFISAQGAVPGIQLAHAGFKGSTHRPWDEEYGEIPPVTGGWQVYAPSNEPFSPEYPQPTPLDNAGIDRVVTAFSSAAERAVQAGFRVVEVHAAHGYLLHEFLSPLSNNRTDDYGGSLANRMRLVKRVVTAVRQAVGPEIAVFVRLSATDWMDGGLTGDDAVTISKELVTVGADVIDVSSGGVVPKADIPSSAGYQVKFAAQIRAAVDVPVGTVGMITQPAQAEQILVTGQADLVALARELLRDPYWPIHAAQALQVSQLSVPPQYLEAY
jgi:2,4-dienoyl-CoA reductase-like NADH-dependent reductase (Old Yellow Enzyme family)